MDELDASSALAAAKTAVRTERLRIARSAESDADERQLTAEDLMRAILTATAAELEDRGCQRWRLVGGVDIDKMPITLDVEIEPNWVRVVKVF